jgi:hypothetical protein
VDGNDPLGRVLKLPNLYFFPSPPIFLVCALESPPWKKCQEVEGEFISLKCFCKRKRGVIARAIGGK